MNLERSHEIYDRVLEICKKKNSSLAQAMREFDVPRNTIHDYIGMCELKIIDIEKYHSVVQQERGAKGKAPVKNRELRCREALSGYRAQSNNCLKKKENCFPSIQMKISLLESNFQVSTRSKASSKLQVVIQTSGIG